MLTSPTSLLKLWLVLSLLLASGIATFISLIAWKGVAPLTRTNYFGISLGTGLLGTFFLFLVFEGENYLLGLPILLFGVGLGSLVAIFLCRQSTEEAKFRWKLARLVAVVTAILIVVPPFIFSRKDASASMSGSPLPVAELAKIKLDGATIDDVGFLNGTIYNGTKRTVLNVTIELTAYGLRQYSAKEFAARIKAKYPKDDSLAYTTDDDVAQAWIRKYPGDAKYLKGASGTGADGPTTIADETRSSPVTRNYVLSTFCKPYESENIIANIGFPLKGQQHWSYKIVSATGFEDGDE